MANSEDLQALEDAYNELKIAGGLAVWNDVTVVATTDDFGNVTTDETRENYDIFVIPLEVEDGWISSGIANANNRVFLVAGQQLLDYGVEFDKVGETIAYNNETFIVELDKPYETGNVKFLHRFICGITS